MGILFFGHAGVCKRCKKSFCASASRNYCATCFPIVKAWAQRKSNGGRSYGRRYNAPTPAQEAYEQGDADMYRRALNGELD